MEAIKLINEYNRMCNFYGDECEKCPFISPQCDGFLIQAPERAVPIIEKWSKEHPPKTRQDEFLEHYPNAWIEKDALVVCPQNVDQDFVCPQGGCYECQKQYWLTPVEEEKDEE